MLGGIIIRKELRTNKDLGTIEFVDEKMNFSSSWWIRYGSGVLYRFAYNSDIYMDIHLPHTPLPYSLSQSSNISSHPGCQISILYKPSAYRRRRRTLLSNMKGISMDEGGDGAPARNLNQAIEYFITFAQQHNSIA